MAKRKAENGEKQSEKLIVNLTPTLKRNWDALIKLKGKNTNELLTSLIENAIAENKPQIDKILKLDAQYNEDFNAILAQDLGSELR